MLLENKIALIIGGSSGIGKAIAECFAEEGAQIAVVASHSLSKAQAVCDQLQTKTSRARAYTADIRSIEAVNDLIEQVSIDFGGIDILVNSAGVYYPTKLGETSEEDIDRMVDINFKGTYHTINAVAPIMHERGGGKIINVASVAAFLGLKEYPLYCASKSAIVMLTRAMTLQLAPMDININAIAPGNTATPINEDIRTAPEYAERRAKTDSLTPSNQSYSTPEEIAQSALFLASNNSRAMHGSTILIDEGRAAGF